MQSPTFELNHQIIRAGAGAGKTYTLTLEVLDTAEKFFECHGRYPNMVITTFTVKATQELRERLILRALERDNLSLLQFVSSKSNLHISTIHGVLSSFLSRYAHKLNLDSSFKVLNQFELMKFVKIETRKLIFENTSWQSLLEICSFEEIAYLLLAFYEEKITHTDLQIADEDFLLKSLKSARTNLSEQLFSVIPELQTSLQNYTDTSSKSFQSWQKFLAILVKVKTEVTNEDEFFDISELVDELGRFPTNPKKNPIVSPEILESSKVLWQNIKDENDNELRKKDRFQELVESYSLFRELAEAFVENWKAVKSQSGKISMNDLELESLKAVREFPDVTLAFSNEWDCWYVDEFQDTSPIQVEILNSFMGDKPRFYVGDPQQSIYLFRGSDKDIFDRVENELSESGGNLKSLLKNYRSDPETLEFFNSFFSPHKFSIMEPKSNVDKPGQCVATYAKLESKQDENTFIVNEIIKLKDLGVELGEICVLSRKNSHLLDISESLRNAGVACNLHISGNLKEKREIKDILSLALFLLNPYDNKNLIALLRSPYFRIEDSFIVSSCSYDTSLWQSLQKNHDQNEVVSYLRRLTHLRFQQGVFQTILQALRERGIFDTSHLQDSSGKRESNIWKLLCDLQKQEFSPSFSYIGYLKNSFTSVDIDSGDGDSEAVASLEPNRVHLMTIHRSKGLQFKYVFVPRMHESPQLTNTLKHIVTDKYFAFGLKLASSEKTVSPKEIRNFVLATQEKEKEESKRLLYVALTRAVRQVYLSWQENIKKGSWVEVFNLDFDQEQTVKHEKFSIRLINSTEERREHKENEKISVDVPYPFLNVSSEAKKVSVTNLLDYSIVSEKNSLVQLQDKIQRTRFGILVHKVFEILRYQSGAQLDEFLAENFSSDKSIRTAIDFVLNYKEIPFAELLKVAHVEFGFVLQHENLRLEGQIDLWAEWNSEIYIIDYKTGNKKYKAKAFEQLNLYAFALRKLGYKNKIKLVVVYPMDQYVEWEWAKAQDEIWKSFVN